MRARASEDFATRLDQALRTAPATPVAGGDGGDGGDDDRALVALAVGLRDAARPLAGVVPRQEFRTALAERLAEQAEELAPQRREAAQRAPRRAATTDRAGTRRSGATDRPRRLRGVLAGVVTLVVAGGAGAAVASESALPGGALYPLKRQVEDLRLQLSSPGPARGGTELALARERLLEAEELAQASGGADVPATDTPELRGTLDDFGSSAIAGIAALTDDYARTGDATSLAQVDTFLDETLPLLDRLRTMTPPSVHPVIDDLAAVLGASQADLAAAVASCTTCDDLGLVVAVPQAPDPPAVAEPAVPPVTDLPGGLATAVPELPATSPPAGGGTDGGLLDGLDGVTDPVVPDPVETLLDDLLPAPGPAAPSTPAPSRTSTPLLPLPLPSVTLGLPSVLPSGAPTCVLIVCP